MKKDNKIFITCSTHDYIKRGYERYAQELFDYLSQQSDVFYLIKGFGKTKSREIRLFNPLSIKSPFSYWLHRIYPKKPVYYFHVLGFCFALGFLVLLKKPRVVYALEMAVYKFLFRFKKLFKLKYRLITFTGGQLVPQFPFDQDCYLHHVTPFYMELAIAAGLPQKQQFLIPHFIDKKFLEIPADADYNEKLRSKLNIDPNTLVILSVGNLDTGVKRMDYLIRELAGIALPIHLILLGQITSDTPQIIGLAEKVLGEHRFTCSTVSKDDIFHYYDIADIFVLCSLKEGFGLVYLEALSRGLPVIAHDFPVARYVLKDQGNFVDMRKKGALNAAIQRISSNGIMRKKAKKKSFVQDHYSWDALQTDYRAMFQKTAN